MIHQSADSSHCKKLQSFQKIQCLFLAVAKTARRAIFNASHTIFILTEKDKIEVGVQISSLFLTL